MQCSNVRQPVEPLTEEDARFLIAEGIFKAVHNMQPTRFALTVGCDAKTAAKARDRKTTLRADNLFNCLLADPHALDPILAHYGLRVVEMEACNEAALPLADMSRLGMKIGEALDPKSPGGTAVTDDEMVEMEEVAVKALGALSRFVDRIKSIKQRHLWRRAA